jgi:hypothetical protein
MGHRVSRQTLNRFSCKWTGCYQQWCRSIYFWSTLVVLYQGDLSMQKTTRRLYLSKTTRHYYSQQGNNEDDKLKLTRWNIWWRIEHASPLFFLFRSLCSSCRALHSFCSGPCWMWGLPKLYCMQWMTCYKVIKKQQGKSMSHRGW